MELTDGGTIKKKTEETKALNQELEKAKAIASRPAKETAAYSKARAATDTPGLERGATGVGGGSGAKDFSRQAQGLGGLVHVYATFAANIFAVSAAFTALSKAADYTNMVAGLDQLGAASGRNLGYLAKDLIKATDGAVSLKEAMTAVAQASSGGMDSTQIARLGVLSKKVSQALGRDITDSLSRLTRGITKIEPELLDELGIFVRVDKAAADYARTIGKTAAGLTDYERRQAFANAVLDQAQKKFGAIELSANPYSKLQASFVDLLYKGGELLNKVLGPIVGLLAQSPLALGTVIAGFTGMLVSKAIPALGQWRKGLVDSAEAAAKKATQMRESLQDYNITRENKIISGHEKAAAGYTNQAYEFARDNKLFGPRSKSLYSLASGDSAMAEKQSEIKIKAINNQLVTASKLKTNATKDEIDQQKILIATLENQKRLHQQNLAIITMAKNELAQASAAVGENSKTPLMEKVRDTLTKRAARGAFSSRTVSEVSEDIEGKGYKGAWQSLTEKINLNQLEGGDEKLGKLGITALKARTGIVMLTSAVSTGLSFLSPYIMLIGLAVAAFQLLDGWLTTNSKQQDKFKESTEKASSAVDSLNNTLNLLETRDPFEKMSVDSLLARANALKELGTSMKELLTDYNKMQQSQNAWSATVDWVSVFWDGSNAGKLRDQMAISISTAVKGLPDTSAGKEAKKALEDMLGTKDLSKKGIAGVLDEDKVRRATELLSKYGEKSSRSLNNLKGAFDGLNEASKDYDNVVNSLTSTDPFARMALSSAKAFGQIITQLDTTENKLAALQEITKDFNRLRLLPEGVGIELVKNSEKVEKYSQLLKALDEGIVKARSKVSEAENAYNENLSMGLEISDTSRQNGNSAAEKVVDANTELVRLQAGRDAAQKVADKLSGDVVGAFQKGAIEAVAKLQAGIALAFEKAKIDTTRALISKSITTFSGIQLEANLKKQEIDIGLRQLRASVNMLFSQERLRLAIEENTLKDKNPNSPLLAGIKQAQEALNGKNPDEIIGKLDALMKSKSDTEADKNARAFATTAFGAVAGLREKEVTAKGQKSVININAKQDRTDLEGKRRQEELDHEAKLLDSKLKDLDISNKATGVYDKQLTLKKHALEISQESNTANKLDEEYQSTIKGILEKRKAGANKEVNNEELKTAGLAYSKKLVEQQEASKINARNRSTELIEGELSLNKAKREEAEKYLDLQVRTNSILEEAGVITKSESEAIKFQLDQTKRLAQYREDIATMERKRDTTNATIIDAEIVKKQQLYEATERVAQAEFKYQQALQKNTDLLKSLETSGSYGEKYFGAVADDFSNKLTALIKASKSAADVFNDGLINMIDKTIDKFYELMQRSELTLKDMVFFARNALSDVFRDAASQTMKNAWKNLAKDFLPKTEADVALDEAKKANVWLQQIALNTGGVGTTGKLGISGEYTSGGEIDQSAEMIAEASSLQVEAGNTSIETAKQTQFSFGKMFDSLTSRLGIFGQMIQGLGGTLMTFINNISLTNAMAGAANGSGFFGTIGGFFNGLFGGGASTTATTGINAATSSAVSSGTILLAAKGGVFESPGLSTYSNSIVSSPTYFAKGGVPGMNIMGEAGPEAIMPLKRDSQGNLGVSGSQGAGGNNITIQINISEGQATQGSSSGDLSSTAGQLGNIIKQVVGQELIKQTRPGGLLAR